MNDISYDFTNEKPHPMLVRANKVGTIILGWHPKTAANWRSLKIGPPYYQDNLGSIYYKVEELIQHFTRHPIETKDNPILRHNNDCDTNT